MINLLYLSLLLALRCILERPPLSVLPDHDHLSETRCFMPCAAYSKVHGCLRSSDLKPSVQALPPPWIVLRIGLVRHHLQSPGSRPLHHYLLRPLVAAQLPAQVLHDVEVDSISLGCFRAAKNAAHRSMLAADVTVNAPTDALVVVHVEVPHASLADCVVCIRRPFEIDVLILKIERTDSRTSVRVCVADITDLKWTLAMMHEMQFKHDFTHHDLSSLALDDEMTARVVEEEGARRSEIRKGIQSFSTSAKDSSL